MKPGRKSQHERNLLLWVTEGCISDDAVNRVSRSESVTGPIQLGESSSMVGGDTKRAGSQSMSYQPTYNETPYLLRLSRA